MDAFLVGKKHRYHVESLISSDSNAYIYRAFVRRKSGDVIKRRYFAIVVPAKGIASGSLKKIIASSLVQMPFQARVDDVIENDDGVSYVIAKGKPAKPSRFADVTNKGYLMVLLAAMILILMIVKFFNN